MLKTALSMLNFKIKLGSETAYIKANNAIQVINLLLQINGLETDHYLDLYGSDIQGLEKMYLDYVNNFVSVQAFADHYGLNLECANSLIKYFQ